MNLRRRFAEALAATLLAGEWTRPAITERVTGFFGSIGSETHSTIVNQLIEAGSMAYPPSPGWLAAHFSASAPFQRLVRLLGRQGYRPAISLAPPQFAPLPAFADLDIPRLATPKDLADWLDLPLAQLDWLADSKRLQARTAIPVLQHYTYTFSPKRNGSLRLIEAPKPVMARIQRRILHGILDHAPPHDSAHGFVKGRSCLSGAQIHAGDHLVVTMDLRCFFASVRAERVHAIFRSLGYPWAVARLFTGLCTTATPASVFSQSPVGRQADWRLRNLLGTPHLPQGAPTSPALANLSAWRLDQRLAGLARCLGANYTRYADDIAFSGDEVFAERTQMLLHVAKEIVESEGFAVNARKTRLMRRGARQQVTGIVVNDHLNIPRASYDALKAVLHNCATHGPAAQNRDGVPDFRTHLDGRVAWVEVVNPSRGGKLRRIFEAIAW